MIARALLLLSLLWLTACARPQSEGFAEPHSEASQQEIFIATMRSEGQIGRMFGEARSRDMSYAKATISIPPRTRLAKSNEAQAM